MNILVNMLDNFLVQPAPACLTFIGFLYDSSFGRLALPLNTNLFMIDTHYLSFIL